MLGIAFITPEEGIHQPGGDQETQPRGFCRASSGLSVEHAVQTGLPSPAAEGCLSWSFHT